MTDEMFEPPPAMEAYILAAFDDFERRRRRLRVLAWAGTLAAALAFMVFLRKPDFLRKPEATGPMNVPITAAPAPIAQAPVIVAKAENPKPARRRKTPPAFQREPDFIPIPYTLPLEATERASVVRMELPVAALVAAGFSAFTADAGAHANADVLVGEDGRARAIRVISLVDYRGQ